MWLLTGPFDSGTGDVTTTKTKLLKTGRKIPLGRKEKPLVVNNKKISRDHCEFTVGPCTPDDAADPSFVPRLEIYNAKEKPMSIDRDGEPVIVNPSSSCELKSGDKVNIVVGVSVDVNWRRVACFLPPARSLPSISNEDCAAMGISLITSPNSLATHHLTPKYELNVPLATSLLSATQLVKVEWLQELIRLGSTPDDNPFKLTPLEQTFAPPSESKYRPVFSPSLATSLKSFKYWEPNEERLHLLKGYRFVLLTDAEGQVDVGTRELIVRGDGEYEGFPLTSGEAKWRQLLGKAKRKVDEAGLKVAIVDRKQVVQATVGADKWREMSAEAQSLSLPVVTLDTLMNAVINTDASLVDRGSSSQGASAASESPLPDFVPNTLPSEPSLPPAPERAPVASDTRRKSPSPSPPPTLFGLAIPPPPSKGLIRRNKPPSTRSRAEEPAESKARDETQAENLGYTLPPLPEMTRSSKLKRRTPAPAPSVEEVVAENERSQEPPLKKFKALFDASDPDKMAVDSQDVLAAYDIAVGDSVGVTQGGESLTQSDSRPPRSQMVVPPRILDAVAEEEEEGSDHSHALPTAPALPRSRRKSPLPQDTQQTPVNATQDSGTNHKPPSKRGKPKTAQSPHMDTDPAFLTALASRKGKKTTEDNFDREFNNLRISKPDICREEDERAWEMLGDFDAEARNMRGNFMVVIDLDVLPRNRVSATRTYDGRPNFKKFKKTPTPSSRAPVELIAKAEHEYGVGSGYWKESTALDDEETFAPTPREGTQKRRAAAILESDGADSDVPVAKPTVKATRKATQSKGRAAAKKLFLEDSEPDADPQETVGKSLAGKVDTAANLPTRGSKRRHIIVDDDSDDGVAFKGFGKKRKTR